MGRNVKISTPFRIMQNYAFTEIFSVLKTSEFSFLVALLLDIY